MVCQKYMKWYTAGIPKVYWMVFKRHIQGILKVYQRFIQDIFMVNKIVNQTHIEAIIKVCSLYITYGWSRHASYSGSTSSKKQPCPKKKCNTYISWGSVGGVEHIYIYIIIYIYIYMYMYMLYWMTMWYWLFEMALSGTGTAAKRYHDSNLGLCRHWMWWSTHF